MSERCDVYMAGVGGQGIGLLAEALARAADKAGIPVKGCDTHGLAQRGGVVSSHLRLGAGAHSPLVSAGACDLVIGLEIHEGLRAARSYLKPGGALVWYDVCLEPLPVRLREAASVDRAELEAACAAAGWRSVEVKDEGLADPRMQNTAVVRAVARAGLLPGVRMEHYRAAYEDLMAGSALEKNLEALGA